MLLAQHGADVIKMEPRGGDWARSLGQEYGDHSAFSIAANLGKRGIVVGLKHQESRAIVDRMIVSADVFIEGFRPGVMDRLGYSHERLKGINPSLIFVSVSSFGQAGPMRERPPMDPLLQAFTGFMPENTGTDGIPTNRPSKGGPDLVDDESSQTRGCGCRAVFRPGEYSPPVRPRRRSFFCKHRWLP